MKELNIYIDEPGNLGAGGDYFVIACTVSESQKSIKNFMKKAELKVKKHFPEFSDKREIKAGDSYPPIKDYYLRKLSEKELDIYYIVARKSCIYENLKEDKNCLYSYLLHFVILKMAKAQQYDTINIILDNRSIKTKSTNSFADYIKIKLNYELRLTSAINVRYVESSGNYMIQVSDFIANAIWTKYEHGYSYFYDIIAEKVKYREEFPRKCFP
jgi:hypothetical protein